MGSKLYKKIVAEISEDAKIFARNSLDMLDRINTIMEEKNISQRELAKRLNVSPATISNMLSAGHNLTLKTISKLEYVLEEKIIMFDGKKNSKPRPTKKVSRITYGFVAGKHRSDDSKNGDKLIKSSGNQHVECG